MNRAGVILTGVGLILLGLILFKVGGWAVLLLGACIASFGAMAVCGAVIDWQGPVAHSRPSGCRPVNQVDQDEAARREQQIRAFEGLQQCPDCHGTHSNRWGMSCNHPNL